MTRKLLFVYLAPSLSLSLSLYLSISFSLSLFTSSAGETRNECLVDGTFPESGTRKPGSRDCLMRFCFCESGVYSVHMRSFYRVILLCYAWFSKEKSRAPALAFERTIHDCWETVLWYNKQFANVFANLCRIRRSILYDHSRTRKYKDS